MSEARLARHVPVADFRVVAEGLRFPEGPVALADGSVALVESAHGTVSRVAPDGSVTVIAECGGAPNGLAIGSDGSYYVCNNGGCAWDDSTGLLRPVAVSSDYAGGSIQRVDARDGTVTTLYTHCGERRLSGPNDLVFDPHGGFYFTDLGRAFHEYRDHGGVYYATIDGTAIRQVAFPFAAPNGIGLSPDDDVLYVVETETGRLWAYDVEGPGRVSRYPFPSLNGARFIAGLPGFQRCDSLALDQDGNVCIAALMSGAIVVVSPRGEILDRFDTGDPITTNICFGGPDMRTAFVTLGGTGRLLARDWPRPGLRLMNQRERGPGLA